MKIPWFGYILALLSIYRSTFGEGEKYFFHEQKMAKLSGVAQGSGPSLFASNSSTEREDGEFVTGNARSLSGLSRRDEAVLWQDPLPAQFR